MISKEEYEQKCKESNNYAIVNSLLTCKSKLADPSHRKICTSISGGSDSDIVLDILASLDSDKKVEYVFFDTGLEYQATKEHLEYLEEKYGIKIQRYKAIKPIPVCCREYGQPFISKKVSDYIERLQKYGFKWEDKPFDVLYAEYPKCKAALRWWCNEWGEGSRFNITYNRYLKEFMVENPPEFKISNKCCMYAKKKVVHQFIEDNSVDLNIYGVRKSEGGARATAYKNCFTSGEEKGSASEYRTIFWYKDEDKKTYEDLFNVKHSKCYSEYGLLRTGCAGCPFGRDYRNELEIIQKYEPKLFVAINNIFKDSYEYTNRYKQFVAERKGKND